MRVSLRRIAAQSVLGLLAVVGTGRAALAQSAHAVAANARVQTAVQDTRTTQLHGHVPEWATAANDLGRLQPTRRLDNLHLILTRAPQVQAAFEQLLTDQQDPASPRFHQWLTPQQNAQQFGVAPGDLAAVTGWLQSQGLAVDDVAAGGLFITFSGPVSAVETAFSTSLHTFSHESAARYAPTSEPSVPAAIASVVQSVSGLAELYARPHLVSPRQPLVRTAPAPESGSAPGPVATPSYTATTTDGTIYHLLSPGDFSLIYDLNPVFSAGIDGTGSRVVILGGSRVQPADVTAYETLYSLRSQQPTVVILPTGSDPGYTGDSLEGEAVLDVDRVLGTAPGAGTDLLVTKNGLAFTSTFSMLQYNISTLNDPIQNLSFGSCEYSSTSRTYAQQYDSYFSTAAAQGIGTYVSSGDSGAAGCDGSTTIPSNQVSAINLICASTFVTCVGGTEFADFANPSAYWSSTNSSTKVSALGYIPEGAWNEPSYVNTSGATVYQALETGGGVSITIAKPGYQAGVGVPADGFRDTPDISLASSLHNAFALCFTAGGATCGNGGYLYLAGGTSAAAPSMAGIAALLNQKLGKRQGNLNPLLYRLAATPSNNVFHDITPASSGVSSCDVTVPSLCNNSTPSPTSLSGGLVGYPLTTGFDLATGLGTLDVANFLIAANIGTTPSTLAVTATPNPTTVGATTTLTATITPTGSATPTGTVQFYADGKAIGAPATLSANMASTTYFFPATGTFAITATYSGDPAFAISMAPAVSLEVDAAPFTVTPSISALTLTSALNVTGTVALAVTSAGTFTGSVALSCTVVHISGTAAGSCSVAPAAVNLDPGTTDNSAVLTIATTPGSSGILNVLVTGVSGTDYTTTPIIVTVTAPGFTIAATPSAISLLAGNTATSSLLITPANMFSGTVGLTCTVTKTSGSAAGACTLTPDSVALDSGVAVPGSVSVATSTGGSGVLSVVVKGTGTTTGSTLPATASATITLTVDTPRFTMTASPTALGSITAGATSGNASTITITSVNALTGTVALSCTAALTTGGAVSNGPGCSVNPATVTLAANGLQTAVATVGTSAGTTSCVTAEVHDPFRVPGGLAFAGLLLALFPLRRRKMLRGLLVCMLMFSGLMLMNGCGGGGSGGSKACSNVLVGRTTSGAYTVTVTGVSGSLTSSATFTVTIN